jgi:hypothetical protein
MGTTVLPETTVVASRLPPLPDESVPRGPPRLSHKRLDVTFIKGKGTFSQSGTDTVKLTGLRVSAVVTKAGGTSMSTGEMRIWGMTPSQMNDLSTLGMTIDVGRKILNNQVIIEAGDDDAGVSVIHHGTIWDAWSDFAGMPEVTFHVTAYSGLYEAAKVVLPSSYSGLTDVATIMAGIASLAGWNFQNNGVDTKLLDPYYPSTAWEQAQRVAEHANINLALDDGAPPTLVIWPKDGARNGSVPLVSATTGMIGYPSYTRNGIIVTTRYNPSIGFGQNVKVQSDLPQANGTWNVFTLVHTLDAEVPGGAWQTRFEAKPTTFDSPQIRSSTP